MIDRFAVLPTVRPGVDAVAADSARQFSRHTHDQFGIGVMLRGAQRSTSGRGPVEAQAGNVITVNPGEVHDGAPIGEGGRSWKMLYFDPDLIWQAGLDITEGKTGQFELVHPVARNKMLAKAVLALFGTETSSAPDPLMAEELLLSVLAELGERRSGIAPAHTSVHIALQRLDDDPTRAVSLAELANLTGLSRFQVLRAISRQTGLTPHAYLMQRRVQLARRLIRRGTPLVQAAMGAGFVDQSHMNRLFVKTFGLTPGAYARAAIASKT